MKTAIFCIAQDAEQANHIIDDLHKLQFSNSSISVLMADSKCSDHNEGHLTPMQELAMNSSCSSCSSSSDSEVPKEATPSIGIKKESHYSEGAAAGAAVGGVIGGTIGLLAGIGSLAIPGLGLLIAAGPIMAALSGAGAGASAGHILGGLAGAGVPKYRLDTLSNDLEKGKVFITVYAENDEQVQIAQKVFEDDGAADIATSNVVGF